MPVKGQVLAPEVFGDLGLRTMNDLDFLVSPDQRRTAAEVLRDAGYVPGTYDLPTNSIRGIGRSTELAWHTNVGNLHPHAKLLDDEFARCARVDLSYDVDRRGDFRASRHLLAASRPGTLLGTPTSLIPDVDFFRHLAIHSHKESTNPKWLATGGRPTLIKLCDLREFALRRLPGADWDGVCARAEELDAVLALQTCVADLRELFTDTFITQLFDRLGEPRRSGAEVLPSVERLVTFFA